MAPKMESNKQERSNLLHDNPVARDASGGRPWISKHFQSSMGSAMRMDHEGSPEWLLNQINIEDGMMEVSKDNAKCELLFIKMKMK